MAPTLPQNPSRVVRTKRRFPLPRGTADISLAFRSQQSLTQGPEEPCREQTEQAAEACHVLDAARRWRKW
jgi:hypothetical protein